MEEGLIDNWNSVVGPDDVVYNLGDFSLRGPKHKDWYQELLSKMNGRKILILGNHDYLKPFQYVECGFESVHTSIILPVKGWTTQYVLLAHDPAISVAMPKNMMMFCGHLHDSFRKLIDPRKILNVGVENWDYTPLEWNLAIDALKNLPPDGQFTFQDMKTSPKNS